MTKNTASGRSSVGLSRAGNTKGGSITLQLTSYLTGLYQSVLQINTKIVGSHTADSKPAKQEVNGTVTLPPLEFRGSSIAQLSAPSIPVTTTATTTNVPVFPSILLLVKLAKRFLDFAISQSVCLGYASSDQSNVCGQTVVIVDCYRALLKANPQILGSAKKFYQQ